MYYASVAWLTSTASAIQLTGHLSGNCGISCISQLFISTSIRATSEKTQKTAISKEIAHEDFSYYCDDARWTWVNLQNPKYRRYTSHEEASREILTEEIIYIWEHLQPYDTEKIESLWDTIAQSSVQQERRARRNKLGKTTLNGDEVRRSR